MSLEKNVEDVVEIGENSWFLPSPSFLAPHPTKIPHTIHRPPRIRKSAPQKDLGLFYREISTFPPSLLLLSFFLFLNLEDRIRVEFAPFRGKDDAVSSRTLLSSTVP